MTAMPLQDSHDNQFFNRLLGEAFDPEPVKPLTGRHTTLLPKRVDGRQRVLHRHRHTKAQHAEIQRRKWADNPLVGFTRAKMRERSFLRRILPASWAEPKPIVYERFGPNGAGYRLAFVDMDRPKPPVSRYVDTSDEMWRSDLFQDFRAAIKTGNLRELDDLLCYETYNHHWAVMAVLFLNGRGYDLKSRI
jgi:hypothetical protein